MSLLAVGTIGLDHIETPELEASGVLGGTLTYIAHAALPFAPRIALVGIVGRDFSEEHWAWFEAPEFETTGLQIDHERDTFAWGARYDATLNERVTLFTHLNALEVFSPRVPESYQSNAVVALGNLNPGNQLKTLEQLSNPRYVVCDTMNLWMDTALALVHKVLERVDCLIINQSEARQLANTANLIDAAHRIRNMGPEVLVIKKAEHGAQLFIGEFTFAIPAVPLAAIADPTGAGDAFLGGFAGSLAREPSVDLSALKRATILGSVMASFCVEQVGPTGLSNVSSQQIAHRVEILRSIVEFPDLHAG